MPNKLQVEAIKTGTVIDHIPAGQGIKILHRLQLASSNHRITVGFNLPSAALGYKDIIKIEDRLFNNAEANELALYAPNATINVIEDYQIGRKFNLSLPREIEGVLECPNSNCISHNEPVESFFFVRQKEQEVHLKCRYCEKSFNKKIVPGL